jgi:hypothetical protein
MWIIYTLDSYENEYHSGTHMHESKIQSAFSKMPWHAHEVSLGCQKSVKLGEILTSFFVYQR